MAKRKKDKIYRRRSPIALFFKILGIIIFVLLLLFVIIFFWFQRYVVYSDDGVELVVPFLSFIYDDEEETAISPSPSLIIEEPAQEVSEEGREDEIVTNENQITGIEVSGLTNNIDSYRSKLQDAGARSIAVEAKDAIGNLLYQSGSETVINYDISTGVDISGTVSSLKESEIYTIVFVSCFADDTLAERSTSAALMDADGEIYQDPNGQKWLDPTDDITVSYLSDICGELAEMGFDEIVLTNFTIPTVEDETEEASILRDFASNLKSKIGVTELSVFVNGADWTRESIMSEFSNVFYRFYAQSTEMDAVSAIALTLLGNEYSERFVIRGADNPQDDCGWLINE